MKRLFFLLMAALLGGAAYLYFSFRPLNREEIEQKFIAGIPTIFRTPGGNLELASFKATETLRSSSTAVFLEWKIPGTTTIVDLRVPVTYRYHVQVFDRWNINVDGNTCIIYAPELRPTLPPAIHTDEMDILTIEGPLAWDGDEEQAKLLKSLTPQLEANAANPKNIHLVREEARKTVAEFIRAWLLQRGDWGDRKIENIKVIFREEGNSKSEWVMPSIARKERGLHE